MTMDRIMFGGGMGSDLNPRKNSCVHAPKVTLQIPTFIPFPPVDPAATAPMPKKCL